MPYYKQWYVLMLQYANLVGVPKKGVTEAIEKIQREQPIKKLVFGLRKLYRLFNILKLIYFEI